MDAIWAYVQWHAADLAADTALFLGVFVAARMASAGQVVAVGLASTPLLMVWAYHDPVTHSLLARMFHG